MPRLGASDKTSFLGWKCLREAWEEEPPAQRLLQLRVLRLGFLQDGNIRIGVFPQGEAVLIAFRR